MNNNKKKNRKKKLQGHLVPRQCYISREKDKFNLVNFKLYLYISM